MKRQYLILVLIIILAFFLRFWQLSINPPGIHADEAEIGYRAYSILETGCDPHGNCLPFQSSLETYLVIPSIKLFGLNPFAQRFPSASLGVLTVIIMFFLVNKLFLDSRISLLAAFLMAINPWSIHISRTGLGIEPALFFTTLGITLFLYADRGKPYFLILSALLFGLSIYTYYSALVFIPLFLPVLFFYRKIFLLQYKKTCIFFLIIFGAFYLSVFLLPIFNKGIIEFSKESIFDRARAKGVVDGERHLTLAPLKVSSIFHNKVFYYFKEFENHYAGPLSINYFFLNGESDLDKGVSNHGEFYLFELPFFFMGLFFLFRRNKKTGLFILAWMLIALIPGGITKSGHYTYRDIYLLPIPILLSSFGIVQFFHWFRNTYPPFYKIALPVTMILFLPFIISYLFAYFFDYPVYSADWWQANQIKALNYSVKNQNKYESIFVYGEEDWSITYAFYNKINPTNFQNAYLNKQSFNKKDVLKIGKFYFGNFPIDEKSSSPSAFFPKNSLLIVPGNSFPSSRPSFVIKSVDKTINNKIFEIR